MADDPVENLFPKLVSSSIMSKGKTEETNVNTTIAEDQILQFTSPDRLLVTLVPETTEGAEQPVVYGVRSTLHKAFPKLCDWKDSTLSAVKVTVKRLTLLYCLNYVHNPFSGVIGMLGVDAHIEILQAMARMEINDDESSYIGVAPLCDQIFESYGGTPENTTVKAHETDVLYKDFSDYAKSKSLSLYDPFDAILVLVDFRDKLLTARASQI
jgi:hypothetical protein